MDQLGISFAASLVLAVIMLVLVTLKVEKLKKELKTTKERESSLKKMVAGKNSKTKEFLEEKEAAHEDVFNGVVTKTTITNAGVLSDRYQINADQLPKFENSASIVSYALGFADKPEDPTILNLAGYGKIMRTEHYVAFKLLMRHLLGQIHKEKKSTEVAADSPKSAKMERERPWPKPPKEDIRTPLE